MVNIHSLMKALPVYGLTPETLAYISGFLKQNEYGGISEWIYFNEPPAGQHEPYVDAIDFLQRIFIHQGTCDDEALKRATDQYSKLRQNLSVFERPVFYDFIDLDVPEQVSVLTLARFMRANELAPDHLIAFFERAAEVTQSMPLFEDSCRRPSYRLIDLPDTPSPKAMIEFAPTPQAYDDDKQIFWAWRESMKPIAASLEKELGEPVYYFQNLNDDADDDDIHRFLELHWRCTYAPDSPFVRYLMEASGAADIAELKAALIDPTNYIHPFEMNDTFFGAEASSCRFTYLPPGQCKFVGVLFTTDAARPTVESILLQQIGADVIFAAPEELLYDTSIPGWLGSDSLLKLAMRFCQHAGSIFLRDETFKEPIAFLGQIDELYVVAADTRPQDRWDLCLSDSIEELLWKAIDLKIPAHYYSCDGRGLSNPETCLEKRGVPDRVAAKDTERRECTSELTVVRVDCDWGSSGLWDEEGKMISYDYIDLPLPLIRRIIDWHKEFDATLDKVLSEAGHSDEWEKRHEREKFEIALEIQNTLGIGIVVQVMTERGWTPITSMTMFLGE